MVLASMPDDSERRLAARPVGAQSHDANALGLKDREDGLDDRGFPTPGPR